jgi:hypothetical protein
MDNDLQRSSLWLTIISSLLGGAAALVTLLPVALGALGVTAEYKLEIPKIDFLGIDFADIPNYVRIPIALFLVFSYSWPLAFLSVWLASRRTPAGHVLAALIVFSVAVLACSTVFSVGFASAIPPDPSNAFALWCAVSFAIFNACAADHYRVFPEGPFGHALGNAAIFSTVSFLLAYSGIVRTFNAEVATIEARNASVALGQDRERFLDCPSKQAQEVRTTYPNMEAAALYCWHWKRPASPGPSPGIVAYRALVVTPQTDQMLLQGDCAATIDNDFFVAGPGDSWGATISPNSNYVIVACRTYNSGFRPADYDRPNYTTTWQFALIAGSQRFQADIRCKCRTLAINRASFDPASRRVTLGTTTDAVALSVNGREVGTPGTQQRIEIALDQSLTLQRIEVFRE